jgi:hypothetical protein
MNLKYRKIGFLVLIALLAGSSLSVFSGSEFDLVGKMFGLLVIPPFLGAALYLSCFGTELTHARKPFE